ncbi:hypothetical protein IGI04_031372, partial [Brassica rapa subsp. trilocularis]
IKHTRLFTQTSLPTVWGEIQTLKLSLDHINRRTSAVSESAPPAIRVVREDQVMKMIHDPQNDAVLFN